eukprot:TRINITY_DN8336_c0_g1_i2.p1 TRINITY_DN8336_c0_g1~~TRINITY_DN8336_c0_g1_i2.p1  ORF type:complete len:162 (+),score=17.46 TRINITY_DN8336_c0_g1_i2:201-686(+)
MRGIKVRSSIGIGNGCGGRGSNLSFSGSRSSSYGDGVSMGSIGEGSIGKHRSSYSYWLLMHIGFSFNILMNIGLSSYFMSLHRLLMYIGLSCNFFHSIFWLNMNICLSSNIFMHIRLSSYILMNIRNSSGDVFILRSRSSKNSCECGQENKSCIVGCWVPS